MLSVLLAPASSVGSDCKFTSTRNTCSRNTRFVGVPFHSFPLSQTASASSVVCLSPDVYGSHACFEYLLSKGMQSVLYLWLLTFLIIFYLGAALRFRRERVQNEYGDNWWQVRGYITAAVCPLAHDLSSRCYTRFNQPFSPMHVHPPPLSTLAHNPKALPQW